MPAPPGSPEDIRGPKLLLTEGRDAYFFCIWAARAYGLSGIKVLDFGGVDELAGLLQTLRSVTGFDHVESLAIIRDAESDPVGALSSVRGALAKAGFPVPKAARQVKEGRPRTAVFLFPGFGEHGEHVQAGVLEDLCLATIPKDPLIDCIDSFLQCAEAAGHVVKRPHKARLHAYLAANDTFVGLKLGEAAKAGAWDWLHASLRPFREFLLAL